MRPGLKAQEMIVIVVKGCDVKMQRGAQQGPISGFIAQQMFRRELSVADDAKEGQWTRCDQAGEQIVFLDAGGSAHGAREASPYCLPSGWSPQEPRARLNLKTGVDVVQKLRPGRDGELLPDNRDFILHESAVELVGAVTRRKHDRGSNLGSVTRTQTSPEAPEKILAPRQSQVVQEIDVEGIARLAETGLTPVRSVVIRLQLNVGSPAYSAFPAAEEIAAGYFTGSLDNRRIRW